MAKSEHLYPHQESPAPSSNFRMILKMNIVEVSGDGNNINTLYISLLNWISENPEVKTVKLVIKCAIIPLLIQNEFIEQKKK